MRWIYLISAVGWLLSACAGNQDKKVSVDEQVQVEPIAWQMPDTAAYAKYGKTRLSDYNFFKGDLADLVPADRVFPYDLNTPLFSDYALKKRFIYLPEGATISFNNEEVLDFPVGAILIKNFYYSAEQVANNEDKIIETRLLIHDADGWKALAYLWNNEQTEAYLEITGRKLPVALISAGNINYTVPNMLQCKSCHDRNGKITPIGPSVRQLNRADEHGENQMQQLITKGWLHGAPGQDQWSQLARWDDATASVDDKAHAYLEINCGHCHRKDGPAKNSGLDLTTHAEGTLEKGVYKAPVAAGKGSGGLMYDIVPGKPEESILVFRMESNDPAVMMPELGRTIVHKEGVDLIRQWVAQLQAEKN